LGQPLINKVIARITEAF